MTAITPQLKHNILTHIQTNPHHETQKQILSHHGVSIPIRTINSWFHQWDGTIESLKRKNGSGRPRILTHTKVTQQIKTPIRQMNGKGKRVIYTNIAQRVREKTGKQISDSTIRKIGEKELGAKMKRGLKRTSTEVSAEMCEAIAKVRRKLQRIGTNHILFLDETYRREGDADLYTIVLPGEPSHIEATATSNKAARYNMIACISGKTTLPPIIYDSSERDKGITTKMLLNYIRNLLAQAAGALDVYPLILVLDHASIHVPNKILEVFHEWGCQSLTEVIKLPAATAKRLSPLDNALFHIWKQKVLKNGPPTKKDVKTKMSDAWNEITSKQIHQQ